MTENVPVRWDEELAKHAKAVAKTEKQSVSGISLRAGVMTLNDVPVPGNKLACVVVASAFEHKYFPDRYDPNRIVSPACFSLSLDGEGMVPDPASKTKMGEVCSTCELFQWGSDPNGGKGKACKEVRRLAVIPASALKDGQVNAAEMAVMSVSVTNVKNWSNYVNMLEADYRRPPWAVLTEIAVTPDPRTQFRINFTCLGTVSDEYLGAMMARSEAAQKVLLQPYDYSADSQQEEAPKDNKKRKY